MVRSASVALMDARSIAATAANKGYLTSATDLADIEYTHPKYFFDKAIYDRRVYNGVGKADPSVEIKFGPKHQRTGLRWFLLQTTFSSRWHQLYMTL